MNASTDTPSPQRYASVIGLKPERMEEYKKIHANTWPGILDLIRAANIRNYSIHLSRFADGKLYLFSYFEYIGNDFEGDMERMANDPLTQEWWALAKPMQIPLEHRQEDEWWAGMEEVFFTD
jgi:L-rhamnose mutarotase